MSNTDTVLKKWYNRIDQEIEFAMSFPTTWGVFFKPERDPAMTTEQYYEVLQEQVLDFFTQCQNYEPNTAAVKEAIKNFQYKD